MFIRALLIAFSICAFAACGGDNVCEEAADICDSPGDGDGDGDGECSGAAECTAECIVDADSCDLMDSEVSECIAACAGN